MKQGPWTDVYALAAVVYFAITGKTPPTSVGRLMNDSYVPLAQAAAGRYSAQFLAAIDRALAVRPEERTQSIAELRHDLGPGHDGAAAAPGGPRRGPARRRAPLRAASSAQARGAAAPLMPGWRARSPRWAAGCTSLLAPGEAGAAPSPTAHGADGSAARAGDRSPWRRRSTHRRSRTAERRARPALRPGDATSSASSRRSRPTSASRRRRRARSSASTGTSSPSR